jgi:hypothetical protein
MDQGGGELVRENFMVGQNFKESVEKEGKTCTMDGRRCLKAFGPNLKPWYIMDSKHNKCAPIVGWRQ